MDTGDTIHKQVKISVGQQSAMVDEGMAELIKAMWAAGIDTDWSCQENKPGWAAIGFGIMQDATNFANMLCNSPITKRGCGGLYGRVAHFGCNAESDCWKYEVGPMDYGEPKQASQLEFSMIVRFPVSDIPIITKHLLACLAPKNTTGK